MDELTSKLSKLESPSASSNDTLPFCDNSKNKVEEGYVHWIRDLDIVLASKSPAVLKKPVFLLFNEIPGCSTCSTFGREVLMNKTLISAIETYFTPVVVNNRGSSQADRKALSAFGEPTWNNPVVRFISVDGGVKDLIPRKDGVYSASKMRQRIVDALRAAGVSFDSRLTDDSCLSKNLSFSSESSTTEEVEQTKPTKDKSSSPSPKSIYFTMYCFWQGEGSLDSLTFKVDGLISSAALHGGRYGELVQVVYDENITDLSKFLSLAREDSSLSGVVCIDEAQKSIAESSGWGKKSYLASSSEEKSFRVAGQSDQKRCLMCSRGLLSSVGDVKLNEVQKMKLNGIAWLGNDVSASTIQSILEA